MLIQVRSGQPSFALAIICTPAVRSVPAVKSAPAVRGELGVTKPDVHPSMLQISGSICYKEALAG